MKRACVVITLTAMLLTVVDPAGAQGLPGTNLTATVRVRNVSIVGDSTILTYSLLNAASSLERLQAFTVNGATAIQSVHSPSPDSDWVVMAAVRGMTAARWVSLDGIAPGDSTPILQFQSFGLPGIAAAWYAGDSLIVVDEGAGEDVPDYDILSDLSKKVQTVGVDSFPNPRTLSALISRLHTLTDSSCTLVWITDSGLCTALSGDLGASPTRVIGYANSLDSAHTGGSAVTDAAYLMLSANAAYVKAFADTSIVTMTRCGNSGMPVTNPNYASIGFTYRINGGSETPITAVGRASDAASSGITRITGVDLTDSVVLYYHGVAFRSGVCS